ncbi:hypothetical protein Dda_5469 [Drechslerella dactyloides]|uniref:DUF7707 domain-containing protein n=1 Tax=Drechslerella dactyloides TaxID=74499 RepID=A0AAD6J0J8_DREDA|nr:hypothetical protein Dda_5469 [Drechslerella dactyloides]
MHFSASVAAVALTSLLSVVSAQSYYNVNPDDIDQGTKNTWCSNQVAACPNLCNDQGSVDPSKNECDTDTLQFSCICSDNTVPNATQYSQTIPYFLCTYQVQNCVDNCGSSYPQCAQQCVLGKTCGASDPKRSNVTVTATPTSTGAGSRKTGSGSNSNGDDVAFDGTSTGDDASTTGGSDNSAAGAKNAGNRLSSIYGGASAATVMLLSVLCGAFVLQL